VNTQPITFIRDFLQRTSERSLRLALPAVLSVSILLAAALAAPVAEAGTSEGCPHDRLCFYNSYETVSGGLLFLWSDTATYDFYQVRWRHAGGPDHQVKLAGGQGGKFHLRNVQPGTRYIISVQGCDSNFLGSSSCTKWVPTSHYTW
jgi:hypothetical protein